MYECPIIARRTEQDGIKVSGIRYFHTLKQFEQCDQEIMCLAAEILPVPFAGWQIRTEETSRVVLGGKK